MIIWEFIADWNGDIMSDIESPTFEHVVGFAEQEFHAGFLTDPDKYRDGWVEYVKLLVTDDGGFIELDRAKDFFCKHEWDQFETAY